MIGVPKWFKPSEPVGVPSRLSRREPTRGKKPVPLASWRWIDLPDEMEPTIKIGAPGPAVASGRVYLPRLVNQRNEQLAEAVEWPTDSFVLDIRKMDPPYTEYTNEGHVYHWTSILNHVQSAVNSEGNAVLGSPQLQCPVSGMNPRVSLWEDFFLLGERAVADDEYDLLFKEREQVENAEVRKTMIIINMMEDIDEFKKDAYASGAADLPETLRLANPDEMPIPDGRGGYTTVGELSRLVDDGPASADDTIPYAAAAAVPIAPSSNGYGGRKTDVEMYIYGKIQQFRDSGGTAPTPEQLIEEAENLLRGSGLEVRDQAPILDTVMQAITAFQERRFPPSSTPPEPPMMARSASPLNPARPRGMRKMAIVDYDSDEPDMAAVPSAEVPPSYMDDIDGPPTAPVVDIPLRLFSMREAREYLRIAELLNRNMGRQMTMTSIMYANVTKYLTTDRLPRPDQVSMFGKPGVFASDGIGFFWQNYMEPLRPNSLWNRDVRFANNDGPNFRDYRGIALEMMRQNFEVLQTNPDIRGGGSGAGSGAGGARRSCTAALDDEPSCTADPSSASSSSSSVPTRVDRGRGRAERPSTYTPRAAAVQPEAPPRVVQSGNELKLTQAEWDTLAVKYTGKDSGTSPKYPGKTLRFKVERGRYFVTIE
jgi:hypothetical protein